MGNQGECRKMWYSALYIYRKRRVKTSEEEFIVNVQRIDVIVEYKYSLAV